MAEKAHDLEPDELEQVVAQAGMGAVKCADLSSKRTKDYVFDVDRMVSLHGDTGVYLQYAHARIRSILRKAPLEVVESASVHADVVPEPAERALALTLDEFGHTLAEVSETLEPHRLCGYLFSLAKTFSDFYEACPVLQASTPAQRDNRIQLCQLTGQTLAHGLNLLGIAAPQRI